MQFSYTSEYYKERLRTFIGEDALKTTTASSGE